MKAGAVLCHRGRVRLPAGMSEAWRIFCRPGTKVCGLYECRGTSYLGARNLSWYRILIASRCACPGATAITNLSRVQEQSKKCDKQLTFIVRVGG